MQHPRSGTIPKFTFSLSEEKKLQKPDSHFQSGTDGQSKHSKLNAQN
jgi:hypothetical protein